ncbi:hypothetical protein DL771_007362 [Monosporascus sp. 5C6A]|nr:hypothetical protein DL771_007362 [Monosporascus sp. 5C6A]
MSGATVGPSVPIDYLEFGELGSDPEADTRIQDTKEYLSEKIGKHDLAGIRRSGTILQDNAEELVIGDRVQTMSVRITQLKTVRFGYMDSYRKTNRAKQVAKLSTQKMMAVEEETGRPVENYLMARRLERGEAPKMPMHLSTAGHPEGRQNGKAWYKTMRSESNREFWLGTTREARDSIRRSAMRPPDSLIPIIAQIEEEDNSRLEDFFWNHQRDEAAAADDDIYGRQERGIVIVLDCRGRTLIYPTKLFPIFRTMVLGLASEVARFVFESVDPKEYKECLNVFNALPDTDRIDLSFPTFSTLTVVGINTLTGRHRDKNDVHFGLASLVSLGCYTEVPNLNISSPIGLLSNILALYEPSTRTHYAHRVLSKLPPKINDPWHPTRQRQAGQGERMVLEPEEEPDLDAYDPCQTEPVEQEPEDLTEEDIHGAALIGSASSGSTCTEETGSPGLPAED